MKLLYTDPKKKRLQKIEIAIMVVILPIGLFWGAKTYDQWSRFQKAEALYEEASNYGHAGRYAEATPLLEQALEIYPEYAPVWEELAVNLHMQKNYTGAMEVYEKSVIALPENGNLRRELATAYHYAGFHDKELEAAKIAVLLPSNDPLFATQILRRAEREKSGEIEPGNSGDFEKAQKVRSEIEQGDEGHHEGHDSSHNHDHDHD